MLSKREKRHVGVRFAKRNNLDYKEVYNVICDMEAIDREELIWKLCRRFLKR